MAFLISLVDVYLNMLLEAMIYIPSIRLNSIYTLTTEFASFYLSFSIMIHHFRIFVLKQEPPIKWYVFFEQFVSITSHKGS